MLQLASGRSAALSRCNAAPLLSVGWCRSYSCNPPRFEKKKKNKSKMKLTETLPGCITTLSKYASEGSVAPAFVLVESAQQFGKLPDFERWGRYKQFMNLVRDNVTASERPKNLNTREIMKLIECSRFFPVAPSSAELRSYLDPLATHLESLSSDQQQFSSQDLVSFSGGMVAMSNKTSTLPRLLKVIVPVLAKWEGVQLNSQESMNCLYGLRGLNSDFPLTLELLKVLVIHIKHARPKPWDGMVAGLSGLQQMSDDVPIVKNLFEHLCVMYLKYDKPYHTFAVGNALLGLLRKDCTSGPADKFVNRLIGEIETIAKDPATTPINVDFLQHRTAAIVPLLNVSDYLRNRAHAAVLILRERGRVSRKELGDANTSQLEDDIKANLMKRIKADGRILLSTNEFLHGFQADIVLRIPDAKLIISPSKNEMKHVVVNIEIDGPFHNHGTKQFLDSLRDQYLRDMGITVVRLGFHEATSRDKSLSSIMSLVLKKTPALIPLLEQFVPDIEDFGDSFKEGKKCRSSKVR